MDPLTILGGAIGIGKVFGGLAKRIRNRRRDDQPEPPQTPPTFDGAQQLPFQQPTQVAPYLGNPVQNQPVQQNIGQAPIAQYTPQASPLKQQQNDFLMKLLARNGMFNE